MVTEFIGILQGGPADGRFDDEVTLEASVNRIPVRSTIELKLDGEDGDTTIFESTGVYVHVVCDDKQFFDWIPLDHKKYTRKEV